MEKPNKLAEDLRGLERISSMKYPTFAWKSRIKSCFLFMTSSALLFLWILNFHRSSKVSKVSLGAGKEFHLPSYKKTKIAKNSVFLPEQRCKVIYNCTTSFEARVPYCFKDVMEDTRILLKFKEEKLYIGMKNENKYIKACIMQDKKTSAPVKKRSLSGRSILDPVDRAKRFLVIIQYVIRQIFVENHPTFLRNLQNITIALDIYDIGMKESSPGVLKLVGAPINNSDDISVTVPFTKINYFMSRKTGEGVSFFDDTFESLLHFNSLDYELRYDQMLFTGNIKETGIGFRYGRAMFAAMAKMDKKRPPDFISNTHPPFYTYSQQARYRYILSLSGGGAWTFYRMYAFLTGSLIFCQDGPQKLWYYDYFKPMIHFVPVKEDLSDLKEKLMWARKNPEEAARIARSSRTLAKSTFHPDVVLNEFKVRILNGIIKYQKSDLMHESGNHCRQELVRFCIGPEVCRKCVPLKG